MDLSFINVPTSQDELLGLLNIAYKAGQESIGTYVTSNDVDDSAIAGKTTKYDFKGWLTRLTTQWSNAEE